MFVPEPTSQLHKLIRFVFIYPSVCVCVCVFEWYTHLRVQVAGCWVADLNLWIRVLWHKAKEEKVSYVARYAYEKYLYLIYMYMYMYMYMYNIHGSIEDTHMYDLYTYVIMLHAVIGDLLLKVCRQWTHMPLKKHSTQVNMKPAFRGNITSGELWAYKAGIKTHKYISIPTVLYLHIGLHKQHYRGKDRFFMYSIINCTTHVYTDSMHIQY